MDPNCILLTSCLIRSCHLPCQSSFPLRLFSLCISLQLPSPVHHSTFQLQPQPRFNLALFASTHSTSPPHSEKKVSNNPVLLQMVADGFPQHQKVMASSDKFADNVGDYQATQVCVGRVRGYEEAGRVCGGELSYIRPPRRTLIYVCVTKLKQRC